MVRCRALYSKADSRQPRARVEIEPDTVRIQMPDGRSRTLFLNGSRYAMRDASCAQRFVRHLKLYLRGDRADLITPPDEGAIAPRAAQLPKAPDDAVVVDALSWEAVADWISGGGRLGGRSIAELARLACVASSQFALVLGEWAAQVAIEMSWERRGPMRVSGDLRHSLRPLELAANSHPRAAEALVAALSHTRGRR